MSEFYIEEISPINNGDHNGYHKSDFFVQIAGSSSRVSVYGTQPVYARSDNQGFDLADKQIAEIMCYQNFRVEKIVCYDIGDRGDFRKTLEKILGEVENERKDFKS